MRNFSGVVSRTTMQIHCYSENISAPGGSNRCYIWHRDHRIFPTSGTLPLVDHVFGTNDPILALHEVARRLLQGYEQTLVDKDEMWTRRARRCTRQDREDIRFQSASLSLGKVPPGV